MKINHPVFYKLWETVQDMCPADSGNPADCPLHFLRMMKPAKRLKWLQAQDNPDTLFKLAAHHQCCKHRMNQPLPAHGQP